MTNDDKAVEEANPDGQLNFTSLGPYSESSNNDNAVEATFDDSIGMCCLNLWYGEVTICPVCSVIKV